MAFLEVSQPQPMVEDTRTWSRGEAGEPLPPWLPAPAKGSVVRVVLRGYHLWCMVIGLVIAVSFAIQVSLFLYVGLFGHSWFIGQQATSHQKGGLSVVAACCLSVLLTSWGASLASAGVWLARDACREDSFLVYRSLILGDPVNSSTGVPTHGQLRRRAYSDYAVQLCCVYFPLDILPALIGLGMRDVDAWCMWVAGMSFLQILFFWLLVCINDYICKVRAVCAILRGPDRGPVVRLLRRLFRVQGSSTPFLRRTTPLEIFVDQELFADVASEGQAPPVAEAPSGRCSLSKGRATALCIWLLIAGVAALLARGSGRLLLPLLAVAVAFACTRGCQARSAACWPSSISVSLWSEDDRAALRAALDGRMRLTRPVVLGTRTLPAGAQLLDDGIWGVDSWNLESVRSSIGRMRLGERVTFLLRTAGRWNIFLETYCGAAPNELLQRGLMVLFFGAVLTFELLRTNQHVPAAFVLVMMLALAAPSVLLLLAALGARTGAEARAGEGDDAQPRSCSLPSARVQCAQKCHVCVAVLAGLFGLGLCMLASGPRRALFYAAPVLCLGTHCLLQRRMRHMRWVLLPFIIFFAVVFNVFVGLSAAALMKDDQSEWGYKHATFSFPATGTENPETGRNVSSPACSLAYPTSQPNKKLLLEDFAFFNKVVYEPHGYLRRHLEEWLPDWDLIKEQRRDRACEDLGCDAEDWTTWFVFQGKPGSGLENTTVLTIRGTKSMLEIIMDVDFWSAALLQQALSNYVTGPMVSAFWTSGAVRWWYLRKKARYRSVLAYAERRLRERPGEVFYVSGHSLGGGIANLVGAELRLPAVTFSPPGVATTARLLDLDPSRLQAMALDVIPARDPVPRSTGEHGGTEVKIGCTTSPILCHRPFTTICELLLECGDRAQPPRRLPCNFCPGFWESKRPDERLPAHAAACDRDISL